MGFLSFLGEGVVGLQELRGGFNEYAVDLYIGRMVLGGSVQMEFLLLMSQISRLIFRIIDFSGLDNQLILLSFTFHKRFLFKTKSYPHEHYQRISN